MTGTLRWHSCSTNDFPLKRHKVSKACEACRGKKMRCDGNNPCQRCESNKIKCKYNDKPSRSRSIPHVKKSIQLSSSNSSITLSPPPASSSEAIVTSNQSTPSPPPSTTRASKLEKMLPISCLNKMTLINELYETLRLQQSPKTRRYGTSHPPLLLDFFNITSQPQSIWTFFIESLTKICDQLPSTDTMYFIQNVPEQESNELVKEAFRIFVTHNWLYGAFLDTRIILFILSTVSMFSYMQQPTLQTKGLPFHSSSLPFYSIIIYCILAITFQSAHQALPAINKNFSHCLYIYSHTFYREAHKQFLSLCFPSLPADPTLPKENRTHMILLVQASILLTHFQATAISEEQAFMTLKIGIGLVQQASLTTFIESDEQQEESLIALLKSLDAWYVWLSFYLLKPYSTLEFDINTAMSSCEFNSKTKEQRWALDLTDNYTFFLKNLLKKRKSTQPLINFNTIKDSLKSLVISNIEEKELIPNHIIQVYHDILTIQFYTSQLENHEQILEKGTIDITTVNEILHVLISSCQNILSRVNKLICTEYTPVSKYIPLSLIYAVSFVSDILLKNKELITTHKEFDILYSSLLKTLKTSAPYFEAFQILYSQFSSTPKKLDTTNIKPISPSPTSLSTSSSTTTSTSTTNPLQASLTTISEVVIGPETQFLSSFQNNSNHQDLLIATATDVQQQHMSMNLPMTGAISSRADIDREQLEKLSHNKSQHHYQQQQQQQFQQQQQIQQQYLFQKQLQLQQQQQQQQSNSNFYLQKSIKRNENMYQQQSMNEQQQQQQQQQQYYYNQKRPYQQIYNALGYQMPPQQSTLKRQRSNPSYDYSKSQPASVVMETPTHHERSKSVATEYIDIETNNDAFIYNMLVFGGAATPTPTAEEIYDGNSRQFFSQQQQEMSNNLTKLPLPQPSKPASMISKNSWTASGPTQPQTSSKLFFDSEVQTLHYQTPSYTTMAGLNVIPEEESSLYPSQRASIVSDSSNNSEPILTTTHNVVEAEEVVNAAAVVNWANHHSNTSSSYKRQYNDSITSNSSSLDENDRFHHQQPQPGTSHWINSEKVGDEEFWGE